MDVPAALLSVLVSGPPALDLVNTRMYLAETWVDLLDDREKRVGWLTDEVPRLGIGPSGPTSFADEDAAALTTVRQHASAVIEPARRGKRPPAEALSGLNEAILRAPATVRARWDGGAVVADTHRDGPLGLRLAAAFAEATVQLVSGPDIAKVRRCDAPACVVLFLPRNDSRRWCTSSICGNRARVARYYQRHRTDRPAGSDATAARATPRRSAASRL